MSDSSRSDLHTTWNGNKTLGKFRPDIQMHGYLKRQWDRITMLGLPNLN